MEFIDSSVFQRWAVHFLEVLFLAGGLMTLAVGAGLIVRSQGTLRWLAALNHRVSLQRAFRARDVSRDTRQPVEKHRRWLAVVFGTGAVYALYGLSTAFDAQAVSAVLGLDTRPSSIGVWLAESARWVLIVGNLAAIMVAVLLGFCPGLLGALGGRGSRWYSDQPLIRTADTMHLPLDNWVARFPRTAGWIIMAGGLVLATDFGIMLFWIR
jgi:hypothetical protein